MGKKFSHNISVRLFDIDINNHVNNAVYFTYMEEARTKVLLDQYLLCKDKGIHFIVVEASCKYKKPIKLQDKVSVEVLIKLNKSVSFEIIYTFKNDKEEIYAIGKTIIACFDDRIQRPVRIPNLIIDSLK